MPPEVLTITDSNSKAEATCILAEVLGGKTTALLEYANRAPEGRSVVIYTNEMPENQIRRRVENSAANVEIIECATYAQLHQGLAEHAGSLVLVDELYLFTNDIQKVRDLLKQAKDNEVELVVTMQKHRTGARPMPSLFE